MDQRRGKTMGNNKQVTFYVLPYGITMLTFVKLDMGTVCMNMVFPQCGF